jgi:hypothetical protein
MTRGWKIALGAVGGIVVLNLGLNALQAATGGSPGGPESSSYATGDDGAGAYAELLARAGHEVRRERVTPHEADLDPAATAFVLDPPFVADDDALALEEFVRSGGRLVVADPDPRWTRGLLLRRRLSATLGVRVARPHARVPEVAHVERVRTAGDAAWRSRARPVLGSGRRTILTVADVGNGRLVLLADPSPLQNRLLARADNAQLALDLAGARSRPVVFFETYHGYGRGSGLGAIPGPWKALLLLGAAAALLFMLARVRRLGPPEDDERPLDPPRREYVEAVAATIARTRDRTQALEAVRDELRRRVAVRSGLRASATDDEVVSAARRLGLADDEVAAVVRAPRDEAETLAAGRALARLAERRNGWRS